MRAPQKTAFAILLRSISKVIELHHGDDSGSDNTAMEIARRLGAIIVVHPPDNAYRSSNTQAGHRTTVLPAKPFLYRNHDVVDSADALIATPDADKEQLRSGTWATIRYARKQGKPIIIINPDGTYVWENCDGRKKNENSLSFLEH